MLAGVGWACGSPTAESGPPPGDDPVINNIVEGANGIYAPGSCDGPLDELSLVGHLDLPEPLTDVWGFHDDGTGREYALAGFRKGEGGGGLYVVEVTNPADPTLVATTEEAPAHDVVVWRHYAYTVTGHAADGDAGVVYDLSDPENPTPAGTFPSGHNLFVSDRGYLYEGKPGIRAYDLVPDPTDPDSIWGDGRDGGHDVTVIGDVLYDFHGFDGTTVYDNADPFAPTPVAGFDDDSLRFHHSGWTSADGEYLYILDELPSNLYRNADISVWHAPTGERVGTFRDTLATVHNAYEMCDRLVVSYYTKGVVLLDIGDRQGPVLLDEHDTDPEAEGAGTFLGAWGVFPYTRSGHVLVSDVNRGLYVFRLR